MIAYCKHGSSVATAYYNNMQNNSKIIGCIQNFCCENRISKKDLQIQIIDNDVKVKYLGNDDSFIKSYCNKGYIINAKKYIFCDLEFNNIPKLLNINIYINKKENEKDLSYEYFTFDNNLFVEIEDTKKPINFKTKDIILLSKDEEAKLMDILVKASDIITVIQKKAS